MTTAVVVVLPVVTVAVLLLLVVVLVVSRSLAISHACLSDLRQDAALFARLLLLALESFVLLQFPFSAL